jgi:hypothetical protein
MKKFLQRILNFNFLDNNTGSTYVGKAKTINTTGANIRIVGDNSWSTDLVIMCSIYEML